MREQSIVRSCIKALLSEHATYPFGILREAGVQADLRQRLLASDGLGARLDIKISEKSPGRFSWTREQLKAQLLRVQLEMKIATSSTESADEGRHKRTDVVVLKNKTITLSCYPNGPGDVVAALSAADVAVAVEIKASPSRTREQRTKYTGDLERLLKLNEEYGTAGFFLLLDKSQDLYGSWTSSTRCQPNSLDWNDAGLDGLSTSTSKPKKGPWIEAWYLEGQTPTFCYVY